MTDLEISEALALAIGWKINHLTSFGEVHVFIRRGISRKFDYRDWNVIGPIAERYACFPFKAFNQGWTTANSGYADTPQKAIALAVIGAKK